MIEPVAITPIEDLFSITWNIGPRCNFDCSYCPSRLHDMSSRHKTLAELQEIWQNILLKTQHRNKRYKISFTGGEVTTNPHFLDLVRWLNEDESVASMGFTTNGSASNRYYLNAIECVDYIAFSSHFEFVNLDKFMKNVLATHKKAVKLRKSVFVNVMGEAFARGQVNALKDWCEEHRIPHDEMRIHWGDHAQTRRQSQL